MTDNPYDAPPQQGGRIVESASSRTIDVLDRGTDQQESIGGTSAVVTVDLLTGARVFTERDVRVRSLDGRLLDPQEQSYRCLCGCNLAPLSKVSIVFCTTCQAPLFLTHARTSDDGLRRLTVCPVCWSHGRWARLIKRVLRWLARL